MVLQGLGMGGGGVWLQISNKTDIYGNGTVLYLAYINVNILVVIFIVLYFCKMLPLGEIG